MYRGLPYELPLGVDLYSEQLSIGVQAAALSPERQEVVTEHKLRSEDDARDIIDDIEDREGSEPPVPPPAQSQTEKSASGSKKDSNNSAATKPAAGSN
jgi:hypothetical protein